MIVQDGGAPPRSATGTVYVTVLDENDNAPAFLHVASGQELPVQVGQQREPGEAGPSRLLGSRAAGGKRVGRGTQESFEAEDKLAQVASSSSRGSLVSSAEMW